MADPRKAKTLDEACRNPDGTYDGVALCQWLTEIVAPGKGLNRDEAEKLVREAQARAKDRTYVRRS